MFQHDELNPITTEKTTDISVNHSVDAQNTADDSIFDSQDFLREALGDNLFITCNSTFSQDMVSI